MRMGHWILRVWPALPLAVAMVLAPVSVYGAAGGDIGRWGAVVVTVLTESGHGTGFHISPAGSIVTCHHVVRGKRDLRIRLRTGEERRVHYVVQDDEARDLAILRVDPTGLPEASLGNSDTVQLGDEVFAIGTPVRQDLSQTVTKGIISQRRTRTETGVGHFQTDTPLSPGNSGGPLFNSVGEVIGIVRLGYSQGQNLNFVVVVNELRSMLGQGATGQPAVSYAVPREVAPPRPMIMKVQFWNGVEVMGEAWKDVWRDGGEIVVIERDGGQLMVARAGVARVVNTQDGSIAEITKRPPAVAGNLSPPRFVEGTFTEAAVSGPGAVPGPPSKAGRIVDLECYGNAFVVTQDVLRFIRFNMIEISRANKRLILELEDLMGDPPMMESSARMLLQEVLRGGRSRVAVPGGETDGRAKGLLCVDERNIAYHPRVEMYRVRR